MEVAGLQVKLGLTLFRQPNTDTEQELIAHVLIVSSAWQTWPVCFCGPRGHCPSIMCFVSTRQSVTSLLSKCSSSPQQTRPRECFRNPQRAQRRSSLVQHKHVFYSISFVLFFYISDVVLKAAPPDSCDVSDNFGNGERSLCQSTAQRERLAICVQRRFRSSCRC